MSEGQQVLMVLLAAWGGLCVGALIVTLSLHLAHCKEMERWKRERQRHE